MSVDDVFTRDLWESVGRDLRWRGAQWWRDNQSTIVGLSRDEVLDIAHALAAGDRRRAKEALVAGMSREEWRAYRDGTTHRLEEMAARRAAMYEALERLWWGSLRVVGKALLAALL